MSNTYYWNNVTNGVIISESAMYWGDADKLGVLDMHCFDSNCLSPDLRYGMFTKDVPCWHTVPLNQFPAEFRAYLLLIT